MVDKCLSPRNRNRTWLIKYYLKWGVIIKELGDYLKNIRISNGIGLEEASDDLNIALNILKNLESGNTRTFRDMLELRETVVSYAKYLGLDSSKVVDEFNDFLFEHTSKIKLQDILDAEKKQSQVQKKEIVSPYTVDKKIFFDKKYSKFILYFLIGIVALLILFFILKDFLIDDIKITRELKSLYFYERWIVWMYLIS